MTSQRQIVANQRNAAFGFGPRTVAGKAASARNSLRHGLYAHEAVLPGEDYDAFESLRVDLAAKLRAEGPVEHALVARLAELWWRMMRAASYESAFLAPNWSADQSPGEPAWSRPEMENLLSRAFKLGGDQAEVVERLGRMEGRLDRAFDRTLGRLALIRAMGRAAERRAGGEDYDGDALFKANPRARKMFRLFYVQDEDTDI